MLVLTPRWQNPFGARLTAERTARLSELLDGHEDVLVVEDEHAALIAPEQPRSVASERRRWAVIRSVSKAFGGDQRFAIMTGDRTTVARVEGRQLLATGWVSHVLQEFVTDLWTDASVQDGIEQTVNITPRGGCACSRRSPSADRAEVLERRPGGVLVVTFCRCAPRNGLQEPLRIASGGGADQVKEPVRHQPGRSAEVSKRSPAGAVDVALAFIDGDLVGLIDRVLREVDVVDEVELVPLSSVPVEDVLEQAKVVDPRGGRAYFLRKLAPDRFRPGLSELDATGKRDGDDFATLGVVIRPNEEAVAIADHGRSDRANRAHPSR